VAVRPGPQDRAMIVAALALAIASAVVAASTAILAWRQLAQARIANALPTAIALFAEFRRLTSERYAIPERLRGLDPNTPMSELPGETRVVALRLSHVLDNLGVLVAEGFVKPDLVAHRGDRPMGEARAAHHCRTRVERAPWRQRGLSALLRGSGVPSPSCRSSVNPTATSSVAERLSRVRKFDSCRGHPALRAEDARLR
jgi:hypothetical protein